MNTWNIILFPQQTDPKQIKAAISTAFPSATHVYLERDSPVAPNMAGVNVAVYEYAGNGKLQLRILAHQETICARGSKPLSRRKPSSVMRVSFKSTSFRLESLPIASTESFEMLVDANPR